MNIHEAHYPNDRFPIVLISHAIWSYNRFSLSYRDVSDLLLERGIEVRYQTVKDWNDKFGEPFAAELRRLRPKPSRCWHVDEMHVKIRGNAATSGVPLMRKELCLISSCRNTATRKQQAVAFRGG